MFKNKTILITGGTGSFGKTFVNYFLNKFKNFNKIIVFSREMSLSNTIWLKTYHLNLKSKIRFLGDVRDKDRLSRALSEVDYVIHLYLIKTSKYSRI